MARRSGKRETGSAAPRCIFESITAFAVSSLGLAIAAGFSQEPREDTGAATRKSHVASSGVHTAAKRAPTPEECERLRSVSERIRPGLVLIGERVDVDGVHHINWQGTGFVVSRERRLVATAAHVADGFRLAGGPIHAVLEGTHYAYRVVDVRYHPAMLRDLAGLCVRSASPKDGAPARDGPDVAVVKLSEEGPDPPTELQLASEAELGDLETQAIGYMGFPGSQDDRWPTASLRATAAFSTSRIGGMPLWVADPPVFAWLRSPRLLFYDNELGPGTSGGPLFLANGHVVGTVSQRWPPGATDGLSRDIACRAGCLRELLSYHQLDPRKWKHSATEAAREDWRPDPRLRALREAVRLVRESEQPLWDHDFASAREMCDRALSLAQDYADALQNRSRVSICELEIRWDDLDAHERLRLAQAAYQDSTRCVELDPEWNLGCLYRQHSTILLARAKGLPGECRKVLEALDGLLKRGWPYEPLSDSDRAFLFSLRGQAHGVLGEMDSADEEFTESIRIDPQEAYYYTLRAELRDRMGRKDLAKADRLKAQQLAEANAPARHKVERPSLVVLPAVPEPDPDPFAVRGSGNDRASPRGERPGASNGGRKPE
jgi:Trypsin-like peptidase domain